MAEDWGAVSRAITARMEELPMNQRQLIDRSGVSRAIVREIQHNTIQRDRSDRTLSAPSDKRPARTDQRAEQPGQRHRDRYQGYPVQHLDHGRLMRHAYYAVTWSGGKRIW